MGTRGVISELNLTAIFYRWLTIEHLVLVLFAAGGFVLASLLAVRWIKLRRRSQPERIETKKLKAAGRLESENVSLISHQMRTPLTIIKYAIDALLAEDFGKLTKGQQRVLAQAYENSENLRAFIDDFLNVSKLETGKLEISLKRVGLADLEQRIKDTAKELKPIIKKKNINWDFSSELNYKKAVNVDLARIDEVVKNLLENALNYTPLGGTIKIEMKNDEENFSFKVIDNGIGIPEKEQVKIFNKFFRAVNARRLRSTGTGLGLYLSKQFIEGHNGKIWFSSKIGMGTTFTFTIPVL